MMAEISAMTNMQRASKASKLPRKGIKQRNRSLEPSLLLLLLSSTEYRLSQTLAKPGPSTPIPETRQIKYSSSAGEPRIRDTSLGRPLNGSGKHHELNSTSGAGCPKVPSLRYGTPHLTVWHVLVTTTCLRPHIWYYLRRVPCCDGQDPIDLVT